MNVIDATNVYEETAYVDAVKFDGSEEMADELIKITNKNINGYKDSQLQANVLTISAKGGFKKCFKGDYILFSRNYHLIDFISNFELQKRFKIREDLTPFSPQETEIMEVKADA